MSSEQAAPLTHPSLDKRAQAAAWLARLRGPQRSPETERGFRRWLLADPEHQRAFELLTERLEVAERLRGRPLPLKWRRHRYSNGTPLLPTLVGLAATLVVLVVGGFLYWHDEGVTTQVGEQRTLALSDGSHAYLNTNTRVVVRFDSHSRTIELKSGEALFEVARSPGRPFVVVAGERRVEALGTTFLVRRDSDRTAVTLIEGKVAVASPALMILSPGERAIFDSEKQVQKDQPSLEKITAWRQGRVALEDMPLSSAVAEMNRYSTVKLSVERPEAEPLRVGGFFRMGDSASFARAVASRYGLRVIESPDRIVLSGEPTR